MLIRLMIVLLVWCSVGVVVWVRKNGVCVLEVNSLFYCVGVVLLIGVG